MICSYVCVSQKICESRYERQDPTIVLTVKSRSEVKLALSKSFGDRIIFVICAVGVGSPKRLSFYFGAPSIPGGVPAGVPRRLFPPALISASGLYM